METAKKNPHVLGAAPYVEGQALLSGGRNAPAIVHGIDTTLEPTVSDIDKKMIRGKLSDLHPGGYGIVLGNELAGKLDVDVGDKLLVFTPDVSVTPVGAIPTARHFEVVGIFSAGFQEYDDGLAIVDMQDAQHLYKQSGPTGIRLKLDDMFQAWEVGRSLSENLGSYYRVEDWREQHANFFSAVSMEKKVMFIILSLIVAVAAFNLVSTLVMLVTDKQADIAILRTLGISPSSIMGTFMVQGLIIGTFGILLGVVGGVLLALNLPGIVKWIEHTFHVEFLSADVYYISEVPSDMHWHDVGWIVLIGLIFCLLATLYPAWRASKTQPAEALRYE